MPKFKVGDLVEACFQSPDEWLNWKTAIVLDHDTTMASAFEHRYLCFLQIEQREFWVYEERIRTLE